VVGAFAAIETGCDEEPSFPGRVPMSELRRKLDPTTPKLRKKVRRKVENFMMKYLNRSARFYKPSIF
jgi:hypothetical protein